MTSAGTSVGYPNSYQILRLPFRCVQLLEKIIINKGSKGEDDPRKLGCRG